MEMYGQRQLSVGQQQAWEALNDPQVLKQCVAGCDRMELGADGRYAVGMSVKIGPVSAKFTGNIEMSDVNAPHSYQLNFDGQGGVAGFGKGSSQVKLMPNEHGTMLDYTVNAQVGGKIAQLGQRLIDGVAKSMADDFFARFDTVLAQRYTSATVASGDAIHAQLANDSPQNSLITAKQKRPIPTIIWVLLALAISIIFYFGMVTTK
jgi:uncharacterized protein